MKEGILTAILFFVDVGGDIYENYDFFFNHTNPFLVCDLKILCCVWIERGVIRVTATVGLILDEALKELSQWLFFDCL